MGFDWQFPNCPVQSRVPTATKSRSFSQHNNLIQIVLIMVAESLIRWPNKARYRDEIPAFLILDMHDQKKAKIKLQIF